MEGREQQAVHARDVSGARSPSQTWQPCLLQAAAMHTSQRVSIQQAQQPTCPRSMPLSCPAPALLPERHLQHVRSQRATDMPLTSPALPPLQVLQREQAHRHTACIVEHPEQAHQAVSGRCCCWGSRPCCCVCAVASASAGTLLSGVAQGNAAGHWAAGSGAMQHDACAAGGRGGLAA